MNKNGNCDQICSHSNNPKFMFIIFTLVITPTRELAYQIFETLRKIGKYHDFSAGLVIGGKDLHYERKRLSTCNIIICTPGRILQHMDENEQFDCSNTKLLGKLLDSLSNIHRE